MPFSGTTYSEISTAAETVQSLIANHRSRYRNSKSEFGNITTSLTSLGNEYGPIVAAIDTLLLTDPTNESFIFLKAHITQLLADYNTLSAEVAATDVLVNT
jgi:hypothetical protein